jgi:Sec-independent protein translocase protein TatA
MGTLGVPELLIIIVIYILIGPGVLCLALRVLIWFAGVVGIPEALGRFGASLADTFRDSRSSARVDQEPVA